MVRLLLIFLLGGGPTPGKVSPEEMRFLATQASALAKAMPAPKAQPKPKPMTKQDEKGDVGPVNERHSNSWIVPQFWQTANARGQDLYCLLCARWADKQHVSSKKHIVKVQNHGKRPYSDPEDEEKEVRVILDEGGLLTPESPASSGRSEQLEASLEARAAETAKQDAQARSQYKGREFETCAVSPTVPWGGEDCRDPSLVADDLSEFEGS